MQYYIYDDPGVTLQLRNMTCQSPCTSLYYATHPACSSWFPYAGAGHNPGIHNLYMPPQRGVGMWNAQSFAMPGPYTGMEQSNLKCTVHTVLDSRPMVKIPMDPAQATADRANPHLVESCSDVSPEQLHQDSKYPIIAFLMRQSPPFTRDEAREVSEEIGIEYPYQIKIMRKNNRQLTDLKETTRTKFINFCHGSSLCTEFQ